MLNEVRLCLAITSQAPSYKRNEEAEVNAALRLITALELITGPLIHSRRLHKNSCEDLRRFEDV